MTGARFLVELCHHRWAVPALAGLGSRGGAGRVAELAAELGASRGGLRPAVDALVDLGLARRNPGHGHPLRPGYILTDRGQALAGEAARIVALTRAWSIQASAFRKWSLPLVYGMGKDGARFSELRGRFPGITDRALSTTLRMLGTIRLTERVVEPSRPPGVSYLPTERAETLLAPLCGLARAA